MDCLWMIYFGYFGGIRLFYAPKSYSSLTSESYVPFFDVVGDWNFRTAPGWGTDPACHYDIKIIYLLALWY